MEGCLDINMPKRTILHTTVEFIAVFGFFIGMGFLAMPLLEIISTYPWWAAIILGLAVLGYLAADFFSGFVHFMGDSFFHESTPIIGNAFISPFREHHTDPEAITRHDFVETNGNNCLASILILPIAFLLLPLYPLVSAFIFFFLLSIFATNQFHKWAHQKHPNQTVQVLQKLGLILSPKRHVLHHTPPYHSDFCITVGWLNPVLNRLKFFPTAHRILSMVLPNDSSY